jgi:hypothetical protein
LTVGVPLSRGKREPDLFSRITLDGAKAISALLGYREAAEAGASRKRSRRNTSAR